MTRAMKALKYIIIAAAAALVFTSCNKDPKLKGITAQTETLRLNYGDKARVPAFPDPWNCTDYDFTYTSADPSVVTVDRYGTITTVGLGTTTVTASQGSYSATCTVEVYAYTIANLIQDNYKDGLNGLWEFGTPNGSKDDAMKATVGKDLVPHYPDSEGSLGPVSTDGFDVVTGFNGIDGAIHTRYSTLFELTHNLTHGYIYTILIDALRPAEKYGRRWVDEEGVEHLESSSGRYTTFFNRDHTNAADQYIYWRKPFNEQGLQVYGGDWRSGGGIFSDDTWFRIVIVQDATSIRQYANGAEILNKAATKDSGELPETFALLNGDNDGDDAPLLYSTVAVWDKPMSADEIAGLGGL